MRIACSIVAAGQGTRLGLHFTGASKALVPVLGRAMLYYSLHAMDVAEGISEIVVAVPSQAISKFQELIKIWGFSKPIKLVAGGDVRSASVVNCLRALAANPPDMVLIHDAARACITKEMVEAVLKAASSGSPATLAHPATDTLRIVDNGIISGEIDRGKVAGLETPQAFPYEALLKLHESHQGADLPDDTTLFTVAGEKVKVVFHDDANLK